MNDPILLPAPVVEPAPPHPTKWEREYQAFRQLLPQLLATHRGQYVAIHEGQVVDSGEDKLTLALCVLSRVGNVAIHVGLVTEEREPVARSGVRREIPAPGRAFVIRYRYQSQFQPPAPFVSVTLRNPVDGTEQRDVPAQLDSAGDRTLLPAALVQALNLPQIGTIPIGGVSGVIQTMPSYPVQVAVHNFPALTIEVVASAGEAWVLLGRDVLNAYQVLLAGPQLFLEIG